MKRFFLLLYIVCIASLANAATKPNIVVILADDLGYGDVAYYDQNCKIATPNLDALSSKGVVFKDAHASSSVCTPSRYSLLTGRYSWRSTLKYGALGGYSPALIPSDRATLGSMLQKNGYTTAMFGKWHLGWDWATKDGKTPAYDTKIERDNVDYTKKVQNGVNTRGFDYSYVFNASLDTPPYVWVENDKPTMTPIKNTVQKLPDGAWWKKGPTSEDFSHAKALPTVIDRSVAFINEHAKGDKPYFAYISLPAPHTPILPAKEYIGRSGIGNYGDYVIMMDDLVGKVLDAIKHSGEQNNTLVVFTSDNGCSPAANIKAMAEKGHFPNSVFRGYKSDLFDGGHRVPCIVSYPSKFKAHEIVQTVCLTDFYATFASLLGYDLADNEAEDSFDLLPLLKSKKEKIVLREATVHHSINGEFTIRKGDWKLLLCPHSGGWGAPHPRDTKAWAKLPKVQLYNMKTDPSEKNNVQDKHPEIVKELKDLLTKYIIEGRTTQGKTQRNDGEQVWKQLSWMK